MEHYKRLCLSGIISLRWYTFKLINKNNLLSWIFLIFYLICLFKFLISWGWGVRGGGVIFQNSRVSEKNLISKTYAKVVIFYFFNVDLPYFFLQINNPSFCCSVNFYSIFRWFLSQTGYFNPFGWLVWTRVVAILYQLTSTCIYLCVRSL